MSEPTIEDVQALLEQFDRSEWDELNIRSAGLELRVYKSPGERRRPVFSTVDGTAEHRPVDAVSGNVNGTSTSASSAPAGNEAAEEDSPALPEATSGDREGMVVVRAPNLGTFYRAPKPGAEPFVTVGQHVEPDSELCIIEVMKLFTAIQAGVRGTVREILAEDAQLVEYDQALFVIEPSDS